MSDAPDLAALIGSRICHDLISPIGAINNGVELLMMDGSIKTPEMALISESVAQANARVRFFRIAFGAADQRDQRVSRSEIQSILSDQTRGGRLQISWTSASDLPRPDVKLMFLLLLCLESALPFGGQIIAQHHGDVVTLRAETERLKYDPDLWRLVTPDQPATDVAPSRVQFVLVPPMLLRTGRQLSQTVTAAGMVLTC